jgi:hypothetical protein
MPRPPAPLGRDDDARMNTLKAYALKDRVTGTNATTSAESCAVCHLDSCRHDGTQHEPLYPQDFTARNNPARCLDGLFEDALSNTRLRSRSR